MRLGPFPRTDVRRRVYDGWAGKSGSSACLEVV